MTAGALQTFICFASLLCIFSFAVTGQSNSSVSVPASNNQTAAVQASLQPAPNARMRFCERSCATEALSGNLTRTHPRVCFRRCPEYIIPEEYLSPDAECTICPSSTCQRCRCDTGECLSNTTAPAETVVASGNNTLSLGTTGRVVGTGMRN